MKFNEKEELLEGVLEAVKEDLGDNILGIAKNNTHRIKKLEWFFRIYKKGFNIIFEEFESCGIADELRVKAVSYKEFGRSLHLQILRKFDYL